MRKYLGIIKMVPYKRHGATRFRLGVEGFSPEQLMELVRTMGRLQKIDISKQVFMVGDVMQVENDEQRAQRIDKKKQEAKRSNVYWPFLDERGRYE